MWCIVSLVTNSSCIVRWQDTNDNTTRCFDFTYVHLSARVIAGNVNTCYSCSFLMYFALIFKLFMFTVLLIGAKLYATVFNSWSAQNVTDIRNVTIIIIRCKLISPVLSWELENNYYTKGYYSLTFTKKLNY